jgi:hypothetical protein
VFRLYFTLAMSHYVRVRESADGCVYLSSAQMKRIGKKHSTLWRSVQSHPLRIARYNKIDGNTYRRVGK